jgi:hypothetical protein
LPKPQATIDNKKSQIISFKFLSTPQINKRWLILQRDDKKNRHALLKTKKGSGNQDTRAVEVVKIRTYGHRHPSVGASQCHCNIIFHKTGDNPVILSAPEARRRTTIDDNHQVGPMRAVGQT